MVVLHPFGSYTKGQIITDQAAMAAVKQSGQTAYVILTEVPIASSTPSTAESGK